MKSLHQIEPAGKTPEELERFLDYQIAMYRAQRKSARPAKRTVVLTAMILLIVAGAGLAFLIMIRMLPERDHAGKGHLPVRTEQR